MDSLGCRYAKQGVVRSTYHHPTLDSRFHNSHPSFRPCLLDDFFLTFPATDCLDLLMYERYPGVERQSDIDIQYPTVIVSRKKVVTNRLCIRKSRHYKTVYVHTKRHFVCGFA